MNSTFVLGSPQLYIQRRQDQSNKEIFFAESQRVKLQLRNLEKQLNNLIAAQGASTLNEQERLTQELHLIEQGIQEKQKEACLVSTNMIAFQHFIILLRLIESLLFHDD